MATPNAYEIGVLTELEPIVERELNRHLSIAEPWQPHEYVPWSRGRDFLKLGGVDFEPSQSALSPDAQLAMTLNLLTEDNLPSYHRVIAEQFGRDGAWGEWVGRWTAEEGRHAIAMRDYLVVTRGVDPVVLEQQRMDHMVRGYDAPEKSVFRSLAYVSFQELATRVSHRNTGKICEDQIAEDLLARIAKDENLHMVFYRNLGAAALDLAPDAAMKALTEEVVDFKMPGSDLPNFGKLSVRIANAGVYSPTQHKREVIEPILKYWKVFERSDLGPSGEQARERLAEYLVKLTTVSNRFDQRQAERQS
jgi:acyl-[acyl-carrier-protein] desaturase